MSILSLGEWSDFYPLDFIPAFAEKTIFDTLDFLAANILLLVGGLLTSVFFGWFVPKQLELGEIGLADSPLLRRSTAGASTSCRPSDRSARNVLESV